MAQNAQSDCAHVVRGDEVRPTHPGFGSRHLLQAEGAAGADPASDLQAQAGVIAMCVASGADKVEDVAFDTGADMHLADFCTSRQQRRLG